MNEVSIDNQAVQMLILYTDTTCAVITMHELQHDLDNVGANRESDALPHDSPSNCPEGQSFSQSLSSSTLTLINTISFPPPNTSAIFLTPYIGRSL